MTDMRWHVQPWHCCVLAKAVLHLPECWRALLLVLSTPIACSRQAISKCLDTVLGPERQRSPAEHPEAFESPVAQGELRETGDQPLQVLRAGDLGFSVPPPVDQEARVQQEGNEDSGRGGLARPDKELTP